MRFAPLFAVSLLAVLGCSKGSLYFPGGDGGATDSALPDVSVYNGDSPSIGMRGVYGLDRELFFGTNGEYYELLYIIRSEFDPVEKIERFLFRQQKPLNMLEVALQPEAAFNPMKDAECFIKITGTLGGRDTCDGAANCKLFHDLSIYSETESDTCDWPRMRSFILKVDADGAGASVPVPGDVSWTNLERINLPGVTSKIVEISDRDEPFTSIVGYLDGNKLTIAGKESKTNLFSASVFDLATGADPQRIPLADSTGVPFSERAAAGKDLLLVTPDGFFRLGPAGDWTKLALPDGMAAMPDKSKVTRVESASGAEVAAFRIVTKEAGIEQQQLVAYNQADAKLVLIPMENPVTPEPVSMFTINIVNSHVWLWNPDAPALAYRFAFAENQWQAMSPVIPATDEPGMSSRYHLSSAGQGFVLTTHFEKEFRLTSFGAEAGIKRRVYRHYYYNERGEYTERHIDTIAPPEALRFHGTKLYAERVAGIGTAGEDAVMDYGYVYDFASQRGYLFKDALGPDLHAPDWLSWYGSVAVSGSKVAFLGGCDRPVNRLCLPASHVNRVIDLNPASDG